MPSAPVLAGEPAEQLEPRLRPRSPAPSAEQLPQPDSGGPAHPVLGRVLRGVLADPVRSVSPVIPSSAATAAYVRWPPAARYNATESFRNSSGYGDGRPTWTSFPDLQDPSSGCPFQRISLTDHSAPSAPTTATGLPARSPDAGRQQMHEPRAVPWSDPAGPAGCRQPRGSNGPGVLPVQRCRRISPSCLRTPSSSTARPSAT